MDTVSSSEGGDTVSKTKYFSKLRFTVVCCRKHHMMGVGECVDPVVRAKSYCLAADHSADNHPVTSTCSIHRHFCVSPHSLEDLAFYIVDGLPPSLGIHESVSHAIRARLESRWILRLEAELNVRRQWHASFPGYTQARASPDA